MRGDGAVLRVRGLTCVGMVVFVYLVILDKGVARVAVPGGAAGSSEAGGNWPWGYRAIRHGGGLVIGSGRCVVLRCVVVLPTCPLLRGGWPVVGSHGDSAPWVAIL